METIICFCEPEETYGCFSNWYPCRFETDGFQYTSSEQYMMHRKALVFSDQEIAEKIMQTADFEEIKALGRKVRNYQETVWSGLRQLIVYEGLIQKFSQNPELKEILLSTGQAVIAECTDEDLLWGNGIPMYDSRRVDIAQWEGENLLGFTLMQVREKLK